MKRDIRVLCYQHAKEMMDAGIRLNRIHHVYKSECDKCYRQGWNYEVISNGKPTSEEAMQRAKLF